MNIDSTIPGNYRYFFIIFSSVFESRFSRFIAVCVWGGSDYINKQYSTMISNVAWRGFCMWKQRIWTAG